MNRNAGRELHLQPAYQLRNKRGCFHRAAEYRNALLNRELLHSVADRKTPAEDNARNAVPHKSREADVPLLGIHLVVVHVCIFHVPDQLHPVRVEIAEESGQLKCRTVNLRRGNHPPRDVNFRGQIRKVHLLRHFC